MGGPAYLGYSAGITSVSPELLWGLDGAMRSHDGKFVVGAEEGPAIERDPLTVSMTGVRPARP